MFTSLGVIFPDDVTNQVSWFNSGEGLTRFCCKARGVLMLGFHHLLTSTETKNTRSSIRLRTSRAH